MRYSVPEGFRDADPNIFTPELRAQVRLGVLLGCGFAFTLFGVGGLGSLAAFVIGLVARERIRRSGGRLSGKRMAWWCIFVGGFLTVFVTAVWSEWFWRHSGFRAR
ncbi:MAG TPA: hypothetical protein VER32_09260 [Pyrinomonadaceae bacterium]|nr:hypothetical protein [Pyrinomonadaceae bacterium]